MLAFIFFCFCLGGFMDKKHSECFQLDARKDKKSFSSNVDFYAISIWNSCLSGNDEIEVHPDLLVEHAVLARKNRGGAPMVCKCYFPLLFSYAAATKD